MDVSVGQVVTLVLNGDNNAANYRQVRVGGAGTGTNVQTNSSNWIAYANVAGTTGGTITIKRNATGYATYIGLSNTAPGYQALDIVASKWLTLANVVSISMATQSGVMNAGSSIKVFRRTSGAAMQGAGTQIGYAYTLTQTADSTALTIPFDNSVPQITEGKEYSLLTTTYTPKAANSLIRVRVVLAGVSVSASGNSVVVALFQDAGPSAIAAGHVYCGALGASYPPPVIESVLAAGSTVARTYTVRFGSNATGYIIGGIYGQYPGGQNAYLEVVEIAQ